jgi:putative ATP-binding cassette transporter
MKRLASTLALIWRLAAPYFRSEDRWPGRTLLAAVIAIELSIVGINVLLNQWNNRFYNALQNRDWDAFVAELRFFCVLAAAYIILAVYQLYLNQWLQIRWRRWLTQQYLGRWLDRGNHYRMQLLGDAADNPDQRIAEDIELFVARTLSIGVGLLGAVVTLASFVIILWTLSATAPVAFPGLNLPIPGYLVWAALLYAIFGTVFTHLIGRPLIALNFLQQRYEADFRFNLVRVRENAEQIALLRGETAESNNLLGRFSWVVANWMAIMQRQKRLTFFTAGYSQVSIVFPFVVVSPAYFAGAFQLGGLIQTASAFGRVESSLSFFITVYRSLAEWKAVIDRLSGFDASVAAGHAAAAGPGAIKLVAQDAPAVAIHDLAVRLPNGTPLVSAGGLAIRSGDRLLVTGPTGAGKSTLFRAIAGIWPFGSGHMVVPAGAKLLMLPQRPYFPVARLAAAVTYPAGSEAFSREDIQRALAAVGLSALAERLDEDAHWNRMLSLGEQQRLAIARAILQRPDYLFMDEATASLDEPAEAGLYALLQERLPGAAIVSIGHRAALNAFHHRRLALVGENGTYQAQEEAITAGVTQSPAASASAVVSRPIARQ